MGHVPLATVKELLGHKTLAMTMRYSHLDTESKETALSVLEKRLNGTANYTITIQSALPPVVEGDTSALVSNE